MDCADCTDVNQAPVCGDVTLATVPENDGNGVIGALACTDVESDFLEYTITEEIACDMPSLFTAASNALAVVPDAGLDYEACTQYQLTITAKELYTDEQYEVSFTVNVPVTDVNDLTIDSVAAASGTLPVVGGDLVTLTGTNIGPLDNGYSDYTGSETVTVTYSNGADGVTYYATQCSITVPGSEIQCTSDEGVGKGHC